MKKLIIYLLAAGLMLPAGEVAARPDTDSTRTESSANIFIGKKKPKKVKTGKKKKRKQGHHY